MKNIEIEKKEFSTIKYHAGVYTDDNGKKYEFTVVFELCESSTDVSITWIEYEPINYKSVEDDIIEQYYRTI